MWPSRRRLEPTDSTPSPSSRAPSTDEYVQQITPHSTTNLNNGSFSLSSRPAFGRKATRDVVKDLPAVPFNHLHIPLSSYQRPTSDIETLSSVYSQPSPEMQSAFIPQRLNIPSKHNGKLNDVSPPESLQGQDGNRNNSRSSSPNVSPVTETSSPIVDRPPVNGKHTSGIPVLKKTQPFSGAGKMWSNWRGKAAESSPIEGASTTPTSTRWDEYSGERTTSEKGKPGQVTPSAIPFDAKPGLVGTPQPAFGMTTTISSGNPPVRRKKVASREENFTPAVREEWKGASGRYRIVNPPVDKPHPPGKPVVFPPGSQYLEQSPTELHRTRDAISPTAGLGLAPISGKSTPTPEHYRDDFRQDSIHEAANESREPPSSAQVTSPVSTLTSPSPRPESDSGSVVMLEDKRSPLARHPSTEALTHVPRPPTPEPTPNSSRDSQGPNGLGSDFHSSFEQLNLKDQPQSRFSATTYATTAYDSPPATPEAIHESPVVSPPSPILNRKRPVPPAGIPKKRKPTPSEAELARETMQSKSLPKSPPEMEAQDRVTSLQASLDNLRRRKINVRTVLHELTNVVQPSSIAYDIAARKEVKKTVDGLNRELTEILKEEHETGLKLHRAWKRQDKSSAYEPTTLWVRRVTT
ncbi:MAG: hypothetical protein LQ350_006387 [Teloschistes chrysophthalmus]|nr:MAG: hypothetical protein LQ350_006387 [Niorma chrysophthalma]